MSDEFISTKAKSYRYSIKRGLNVYTAICSNQHGFMDDPDGTLEERVETISILDSETGKHKDIKIKRYSPKQVRRKEFTRPPKFGETWCPDCQSALYWQVKPLVPKRIYK